MTLETIINVGKRHTWIRALKENKSYLIDYL